MTEFNVRAARDALREAIDTLRIVINALPRTDSHASEPAKRATERAIACLREALQYLESGEETS